MRRSHLALGKNSYVADKNTGTTHRPHHIDENGMYNGRQVITSKVSTQN